jgi:hypothetical protein
MRGCHVTVQVSETAEDFLVLSDVKGERRGHGAMSEHEGLFETTENSNRNVLNARNVLPK